MLPLNRPTAGNRSRRGAAASPLSALCASLLVAFVLSPRAAASDGVAARPAPREKDVARAEKIAAKLRLLDAAAGAPDGAAAFRSLAAKLYPGLFVSVSEMGEGDLKTDLGTAAFLYEELGRHWAAAGAATADCGRERADIYLPLCARLRGGTMRELLAAKARLHLGWAEAVTETFRGRAGAETSGAVAAMRAARENDLLITARAVEGLKSLEASVAALRDAEASPSARATPANLPRTHTPAADALGRVGTLLYWLPRGPAYYYLSSAWRGYGDGLYWYQKVARANSLVVSAHAFDREPLRALNLDSRQVGNTAAANFEAAGRFTRLAERSLSSATLPPAARRFPDDLPSAAGR